MILLADKDSISLVIRSLQHMTLEAEIGVALGQHFAVYRTMRLMADDTTLAHGFVLEGKRPGLFAVTFRTRLVNPCHGESALGLEDIAPMRIVALDAIHAVFQHRMMVRQIEIRVRREMTLQARGRIATGIENELPRAPGGNVEAARPMTGFTAAVPGPRPGLTHVNPGMRAGRETADIIGMAVKTSAIAGVMRPGNIHRRHHRPRCGDAGNEHQRTAHPEQKDGKDGLVARHSAGQFRTIGSGIEFNRDAMKL